MSLLRCAILDDYQQVAKSMADWSSLEDKVSVVSFSSHIFCEQKLIETLSSFEIIVLMRERTPFLASMFAQLPKLRLLVTTGMRNSSIDLMAASKNGVVVLRNPEF